MVAATPAVAAAAAIGLVLLWLTADEKCTKADGKSGLLDDFFGSKKPESESSASISTPSAAGFAAVGDEPSSPGETETPAAPMLSSVASFSGNQPSVSRDALAAIFEQGTKRMSRKAAVTALMARGIKQTAAYKALRDDGRFTDCLEVGDDGLMTYRP